jgi:filamentous hemagglutinin
MNVGQGVGAIAEGQVLSLRIGIGGSRSKNEADYRETTVQGSRVLSDGDVTIAATGDGKGNGGDLTVLSSQIGGDNVTLAAANDLILQSMQETSEQHTTNQAKSGGMGITIGVETGGIGLYANYNQAKGHSDGYSTSHVETRVDANSTLALISGNDTTLKGAQARGETVVARIGGDLTLISEQDTSTFDRKDKSSGFDLAVDRAALAAACTTDSRESNRITAASTNRRGFRRVQVGSTSW